LVPESAILLIVRSAVPVLVITTGVWLLEVPANWFGNDRLLGAALKAGAIAVPESAIECGLPVALSTTPIAADLLPGDFGVKATLNVTLLPGAMDGGMVPVVSVKSAAFVPDNVVAEICRFAVPLLVITTGVLPLLVFTSCEFANVTLAGDGLKPGAMPVPVSATVCGLPAALSVIVTAADFAPVLVGAKVTLIVVVAFGATLMGSVAFVSLNCEASVPVIEMPEIVSCAVPLFVIVTGVEVLLVPTNWFG